MRIVRTSNAKRWLAVAIGLLAVAAVAIGLFGLGVITEKAATGASPADAFNEIPQLPVEFDDLVSWQPDPALTRSVEPTTRRLVEAAWVQAWQRIDEAQRTGDRQGTELRFVGGLADQAAETARSDRPAALTQHLHELEVTFYSVDGSVMTVAAQSELERSLLGGPSLRSTDRYQAVFLLSDGIWRLHHLQRL